jgi:hypothetical protein
VERLWADCLICGGLLIRPVPRAGLHEQFDAWVRSLQALLEDTPRHSEKFQIPLENAIRELGQQEAVIRNHWACTCDENSERDEFSDWRVLEN